MDFSNQVAIVTGGAGGIGLAVARRLAADGARVVLADLDGDRAQNAARAIGDADHAAGLACDVADAQSVAGCCSATLRLFGRIDIIVNNAGLMTFAPLEKLTGADWRRVLDVDLMGAVHFTREAFAVMQDGGAIVNVASIHALMTTPNVAPYAAAKAALLSLTRSTAIEGKPRKIRANAVVPGAIDTPMLWDNPNVKAGVEQVDKSEVGRAEDIAACVAFLASADAAFVSGAALVADGGRLAQL